MANVNERHFPTPPQQSLDFDDTPESVASTIDGLISLQDNAWDHVSSTVTAKEATFENTILPLIHAENEASMSFGGIRVYSSNSADQDLKGAAVQAVKAYTKAGLARTSRQDIFDLVQAVVDKKETLDPETAHYLKKLHKALLLNGLGITDPASRKRFNEVQQRIAIVRADYIKNLNSDKSGIWFHVDELDGIQEDFISSHKKEEVDGQPTGRIWVTFRKPDHLRMTKYARRWRTRRTYWLAWESRYAALNGALLKENVVLKCEAALLMGYPHHAAVAAQSYMMTDNAAVKELLSKTRELLAPIGEADLALLKKIKEKHITELGYKDDESLEIFYWDQAYYERLLKEQEYAVDQQQLAEYFPFKHTLEQLMTVFGKLFGIQFQEINAEGTIQCSIWHEDVDVFTVWDNPEGGGGFLGYLYLDLIARDNKFDHVAHYAFQPGFAKQNGNRHHPSSMLVGNFTAPISTQPTLLEHREMVSLFHEMGHAMHSLLSKTKYSKHHGTMVARDFVEIPSRMLENFFWVEKNIRDVSFHYSYLSSEYATAWRNAQVKNNTTTNDDGDSKIPLPPRHLPSSTIHGIITSRTLLSGLTGLRDNFMATFDQLIHSPSSLHEAETLANSLSEVWNRTRYDITGLRGLELDNTEDKYDKGEKKVDWNWGHGQTHFRAIMGSYDAGYYSYLISTVYSLDMFQSFFPPSQTSDEAIAAQGHRYRHILLKPGGSQPEWTTLTNYLGREPSHETYQRSLEEGREITRRLSEKY